MNTSQPVVTQADIDAASAIAKTLEIDWANSGYFAQLLRQHVAQVRITAEQSGRRAMRNEAAATLRDRAVILRTAAGRSKAEWHEMDAEMVARELDRIATAIQALTDEGEGA